MNGGLVWALLRDWLPWRLRNAAKPTAFFSVSALPLDPPASWFPADLAPKADAGARFLQIQFCMDLGVVRRWTRRLELIRRLKLLIEIALLAPVRSARWMRQRLYGTIIPDAVIRRVDREAADERQVLPVAARQLEFGDRRRAVYAGSAPPRPYY
jgi:methylenetetrahydrofolate reductase (NADPH)